jgi:hypothetical protein
MGAPSPDNSSLKDRLVTNLRQEPSKAVVLGVLLLVLVVVAGRELFKRLGPSRAGAAVTAEARAVRPLPATGRPSGAAGQDDLDSARIKDIPHLKKLVVNRDLFTPDPVHFPPVQVNKPVPVVKPAEDPAAQVEVERRAIQAQAKALTLQSTVIGAVPTAIVNGQVLRVGDWVNGFQVKEITSRVCTVEKKGMSVVLEMAN